MMNNNIAHSPNYSKNSKSTGVISLMFSLVFVGYILLSPFYVFESGLPKPADLLIAIGMIPLLIITIINYKGTILWVYVFGFLFVALTAILNFIYFNYLHDPSFIRPIFFYIFNFLVFTYILTLFHKDPQFMNKAVYASIAIVIIIEALYVMFLDNSHKRFIGTFNNPNQLANWTLMITATLIALKRDRSINLFDLLLFMLGAYLETKALSKAGMMSYALLMLMVVLQPHTNKSFKYFILLVLVVITIFQVNAPQKLFSFAVQADNMNKAISRLMALGSEADDGLLVRGYYRIVEYPEYLILGAGEGGYWRFNSNLEFHSSLGALTFSYGVFGLFLFLGFLYFVFRKIPHHQFLLLLPLLVHGIVHQDLRNTMFWVFLAVVYAWHYEKKSCSDDDLRF